MKTLRLSMIAVGALLMAAPSFAQTDASKQKTGDSNGPTAVGPGSAAYKQKTGEAGPTAVGPGSAAYKQKTGEAGPTAVGPGSAAYKQKTGEGGPTAVGPASGAYKQKTQSLAHGEAPVGVAKQQ